MNYAHLSSFSIPRPDGECLIPFDSHPILTARILPAGFLPGWFASAYILLIMSPFPDQKNLFLSLSIMLSLIDEKYAPLYIG